MKKQVYIITAALMLGSAFLGAAAGYWLSQPESPSTGAWVDGDDTIDVQVILSENNGQNPITYYFRIPKDTDYTLLELMERHFLIEHDKGYITSIQGKKASNADQTAWMYDINGEMALVGAAEYRIKDGDVYQWDLRKW